MITVYGSLLIVLLCTFLSPFCDSLKRNKDNWTWKRAVAAYAAMTGLVFVLPVIINGSVYISWVFAILAVVVAASIAPVSFLGTSFVLFMLDVIIPIMTLWEISKYNKVKEPMSMILAIVEWPKLLAPIALGMITFFLAGFLRQMIIRSKKDFRKGKA